MEEQNLISIRNFRDRLKRKLLLFQIQSKWNRDGRRLPLKPEHWELYDIIHRVCLRELHDFPNLINCRDFNDRIQWLKLFDQQEEQIRCSDKLLVRDYILEHLGDGYLTELYQVTDKFDEINFEVLPAQFVIKTNHDSGTVVLVRDKNAFDPDTVRKRVNDSLAHPYGWQNGEWPYALIRPQILVEEFIDPESPAQPADYKFHCVDGRVKFLQYIYDRGADAKEVIVDPDGKATNVHFYQSFAHVETFQKPKEWTLLCQVAEKLSKGWKYVRVDLYLNKGRIYAGELTFFPYYGCYKGDGQKQLGPLLNFDRTTHRPPIYKRLKDKLWSP